MYTKGDSFILSLPTLSRNARQVRMIWIPPGVFLMGSPEDEYGRIEEEEQQFQVTISQGFWLSQCLITQSQWLAVARSNPSRFKEASDDSPVENINWYDAVAFCSQLNSTYIELLPLGYKFSLPTEAQWEYACRAGSTTAYHSGNSLTDLSRVAWHKNNSEGHPHSVGQKQPNSWGIFDMHGNVMEWCLDSFSVYPGKPMIDWAGPMTSTMRNIRGGSWGTDPDDSLIRCAGRGYVDPELRRAWFGMRLCIAQVKSSP